MYHMLSSFNLKPGVNLEAFQQSLDIFETHMRDAGLAEQTGPIGKRSHHPIMDTDGERDHEYYFISSFLDREQCDRSVEYIQQASEPADSIHKAVYSKISEPVFTCWEDV